MCERNVSPASVPAAAGSHRGRVDAARSARTDVKNRPWLKVLVNSHGEYVAQAQQCSVHRKNR